MYKHILVPVDLDAADVSDKAITEARALARQHDARVTVLSVIPAWPNDLAHGPSEYQPRLDAYVREQAHGVEMTGEVKIGGAVSARIIEAAVDEDVDLVVMVSHDPRMSDYLIGSNAAHVTLHVPCSVMIIR